MNELTNRALQLARVLAIKSARGTLNEFEAQLYEATSRFATGILKYQDAISQSAIIRAERELNDLQKKGRAG